MSSLWQKMMVQIARLCDSASEFFDRRSGIIAPTNDVNHDEQILKLKRLLDSELLSADDLVLNEDDAEAIAAGVSLGFSEPVYLVVASPTDSNVLTLEQLKNRAVHDTLGRLSQRSSGQWTKHDDALFAPHTLLVKRCLERSCPSLAIQAWEDNIRAAVEKCEDVIQHSDPNARIHKGAILHNVALCHLVSGDLDSALQLYAAAGKEDELSGRGGWESVVLGIHQLTEKHLLQRVVDKAGPLGWVKTYQETLGVHLDLAGLRELLKWLADKEQDAIHLLHAVHRIIRSNDKYANLVQPHLQVRSIADIILVVESSLRNWQKPAVHGQLHEKLYAVLPKGSPAKSAFDDAHNAYGNRFPKNDPGRETEVGINWAINDCLQRYQSETSAARRVGIVAYLCVRLRNSLMHVILDPVSLYRNDQERMQVAGMMITAIGVSKLANEGTLQTA